MLMRETNHITGDKIMETTKFSFASQRATQSATYKQYKYLVSLLDDNDTFSCNSKSQFMKKVNVWDASEMIDAKRAGKHISVVI